MSNLNRTQLRKRASGIQLAAFDIDGVLTDGLLYLGPEGQEFKVASVKDGHGLVRLGKADVDLAVISGRPSAAMAGRCAELGIDYVYLGISDKLNILRQLVERRGLDMSAVSYMGDDEPDLPCMQSCGLAMAPADAMPDVLSAAHWVSQYPGGRGAVREACDMILAAKGGSD